MFDKKKLLQGKIAVVGLGYVGLPLAVGFAETRNVIGFDVNEEKIALYKRGIDPTQEIGDAKIKATAMEFTSDPTRLSDACFIIVAVPTPVNSDNTPDLHPVEGATRLVAEHLAPGSIVVFESTVWPGVTEDICIPILEQGSGLRCGVDFKVGYSPERINPGDKVHRLENIKKIVSGSDEEALDIIAATYEQVIKVGVYRAPNIKVAEAAKLVENAQRDINIAFMNELAIVFEKMGIRTQDVVDAMNTKWNALGFVPGLVGGHCIGVDPYYFIYKAGLLGYHSQIIAAGRKINNSMGEFVADKIIKQMILSGKNMQNPKVCLLGITFKENCPDIRNSKVLDIVKYLREYGIEPVIVDPWADADEVLKEYGIRLVSLEEVHDMDCLALMVAHSQFRELIPSEARNYCKQGEKNVIIDVKSIFSQADFPKEEFIYWSL